MRCPYTVILRLYDVMYVLSQNVAHAYPTIFVTNGRLFHFDQNLMLVLIVDTVYMYIILAWILFSFFLKSLQKKNEMDG